MGEFKTKYHLSVEWKNRWYYIGTYKTHRRAVQAFLDICKDEENANKLSGKSISFAKSLWKVADTTGETSFFRYNQ
jgi:hypothetical protein